MRNIKTLALVLGLAVAPTAFAWGPHSENYNFQAKSNNVARVSSWSQFWSILAGRKPVRAPADLTIKVTDPNGTPLSGALVLVGSKKGEPFAANFQLTDASGLAQFSDAAIPGKTLPVTASMAGYGTFSLANNSNNNVEIALAPNPTGNDHAFLQGKVNGFPTGYDRRTLEMGMFLPAFKPESLMNFDPQQIISSYKVEIDVFGKREVPGNIVLPPQSKSYGIIPIRLEKPEFIMPLQKGLHTHMTASAGIVPISAAVDAIKAKDFLGVINLSTFTHLAWTRRMTVNGNERFDLNLSQPLEQKALKAKLANVSPKLDAVAVSMFDPEADFGDFITMDVKSLKSEEIKNGTGNIKLGILSQRKATDRFYVFTGLFDRNQLIPKEKGAEQTSRSIVGSVELVDQSNMQARFQDFLNVIEAKGVDAAKRDYRFSSAANTKANLAPDMILVNIVSEKKNAATMGQTRTVLWSTVIQGNSERLTLPDLGKPVLPPPDAAKEERFLWEVIAFKSDAAQGAELDVQSALRNVKHVSTLVQKF